MRRPVILHADPHADTRDLLACMLRVHAVDVIGVDNGVEAYLVASNVRPDALVTEFALPLVDGYLLCERIRTVVGLERIPVIAWTGWVDAGRQQQALAAGFNRVLLKAGGSDIVREILSVLRNRRAAV